MPKKKPSPLVYRQGDVLLIATTNGGVPSGAQQVLREHGRIVLAHGEATGHAHAIVDERAELWETDAARYLRLPCEGIALLHEEHAPVPLPPGIYEVRRQREYTPERIRNVAD